MSSDLNDLLRDDLHVVIASPDIGSIGRETKKILTKKGIYKAVLDSTVYQSIDSRTLNRSLKSGDADVIINWKATAFFEDNITFIDVIDIDPELAKPKKLTLNFLKFSKHPELAKEFMAYAHSEDGFLIFKKFGFIDEETSQAAL